MMSDVFNPAQLTLLNDRILRLEEVKERTGLSRSSIYAYMREGKFPSCIRLGARSVGWYDGEIKAWQRSRARTVVSSDVGV